MTQADIERMMHLAHKADARASGYRMAGDSLRARKWGMTARALHDAARHMSEALRLEQGA